MESCDFHYHSSMKKQHAHSYLLPVEDTGSSNEVLSPSQPKWYQWRSVENLNTYPHAAIIRNSYPLQAHMQDVNIAQMEKLYNFAQLA